MIYLLHGALPRESLVECRKALQPDLQRPALAMFGWALAVKQGTGVQVLLLSLAEGAPRPSGALLCQGWKKGWWTCNRCHSRRAHEDQSFHSHQRIARRSHLQPLWAAWGSDAIDNWQMWGPLLFELWGAHNSAAKGCQCQLLIPPPARYANSSYSSDSWTPLLVSISPKMASNEINEGMLQKRFFSIVITAIRIAVCRNTNIFSPRCLIVKIKIILKQTEKTFPTFCGSLPSELPTAAKRRCEISERKMQQPPAVFRRLLWKGNVSLIYRYLTNMLRVIQG